MSDEDSVAGCPDNHTEHRQPDIREALRSLSTVTYTQHVTHGFENGERIQLSPRVILQRERKNTTLTVMSLTLPSKLLQMKNSSVEIKLKLQCGLSQTSPE